MLYFIIGYFTLDRGTFVDANKDVAIVRRIIMSVSDTEIETFREKFVELFSHARDPYELNEDNRAEITAFMFFLALMLTNVGDDRGSEETELLPLLQYYTVTQDLLSSHQAFGAIFFGFSKSQVSKGRLIVFNCSQWLTLFILLSSMFMI